MLQVKHLDVFRISYYFSSIFDVSLSTIISIVIIHLLKTSNNIDVMSL